MDLATLINTLRDRGNELNSWSGVETNIESVSELIGSNESGTWKLELKVKNP